MGGKANYMSHYYICDSILVYHLPSNDLMAEKDEPIKITKASHAWLFQIPGVFIVTLTYTIKNVS